MAWAASSEEAASTYEMASSTSSEEAANRYRDSIARLCPRDAYDISLWPGVRKLRKFTMEGHVCTKPPEISIVNIPGENNPASEISIMSLEGPSDLFERLPSLADTTSSSQLIMVENICPSTLAVLGGTYDVDPQFFAEHVNVLSWYTMYEKVPERLASLPSTKKEEDFLALRYVETREIGPSNVAGSILWPDPRETRIWRSAGKLEPVSRPGQVLPRMAFTRQTVSIWCRKKTSGNGWIAIMLLDPPFQLTKEEGCVGKAEYRNPNLRPKMEEKLRGADNRQSFRHAFCNLLKQRCSADPMYRMTCATDIFLVFYEGYRIIASEWLVVNEYVKRELANIEHYLEKTESTFRELEQHLRELYRIRRRCNKDRELVTEAASQCIKRGQALWPSSKAGPADGNGAAFHFAERYARDLEEDLQYVLDNLSISILRIEKNITLLMALVTISEGRQGLQENRGIAFLTLVATIFLPFETVATILGMQTAYGPGATDFWMLWTVALPLTILVVTIPFVYAPASSAAGKVWAKYFPPKPKATGGPPSVVQGELLEKAGYPVRQSTMYGGV